MTAIIFTTERPAWGDHVTWMDYKQGRVYGHKHPRPKVGDLLRSPLQSGRVGIFRFVDVKLEWDPPDMFFGTVEGIGYEDELDLDALRDPADDGSYSSPETEEKAE